MTQIKFQLNRVQPDSPTQQNVVRVFQIPKGSSTFLEAGTTENTDILVLNPRRKHVGLPRRGGVSLTNQHKSNNKSYNKAISVIVKRVCLLLWK